jgi:hypothetical protein
MAAHAHLALLAGGQFLARRGVDDLQLEVGDRSPAAAVDQLPGIVQARDRRDRRRLRHAADREDPAQPEDWHVHTREPREYVPELHADLQERARQLTIITAVVTGNIQASAQLRQSVANTKLQRLTLGVSTAATVLAVVTWLASQL